MVSLQTALSPRERIMTSSLIHPNNATAAANNIDDDVQLSKKRKRDDHGEFPAGAVEGPQSKELRLWCTRKISPPPPPLTDIELPLEDIPLPPEWQRCLDIKSGRITFYNTRTHMRTSRDPREPSASLPQPTSPPVVSLDLDLNLGCESPAGYKEDGKKAETPDEKEASPPAPRPSWVSVEVDRKEMLAAVCMRCHMLVMMCRTMPSCPNCKFLHPPPTADSAAAAFVKPRGFRLLCCKD